MTQVLIVDDSLTVRETVAARLEEAGFEVVGMARDGREGIAMTQLLRPDVVIMDVVMPQVDGLEATRRIMCDFPTPVVILSSYADAHDGFKTCDALGAGALEVCDKPTPASGEEETQWKDILVTVAAAAEVTTTRLRRVITGSREAAAVQEEAPEERRRTTREAIVLGASTGGPAAIRAILRALPESFPLPIIVAMHCNRRLSLSMAGWLDRECPLNSREIIDGTPVPTEGGIHLVPPGRNMRILDGVFVLEDPGETKACVPFIDQMFSSAAEHFGDALIGVLLTGMGTDGALGLKEILRRGGCTIVQDQETSVVFGMPAAAIELEAAQHVMPLPKIAPLLMRLVTASRNANTLTEVNP
jgi:two-component system chemotaxis response regulator CheB